MMKIKYDIPRRRYCSGDKKMISLRLPEELWSRVDEVAKEYGWTTTDLVTTALDQLIQWRDRAKRA